jgi:phosphoribosylformylglycinamidine synthase
LEVGFKDLGAGGISCASSEMGADGGVGIAIDLDAVPLGMEGLAPHVISCAETQERLLWIVPPEFTPRLLAIYNDEFDLPGAAEGAQAAVIGTTSAGGRYTLSHHGQAVCDVPIEVVTRGIRYNREGRPPAAIVLGSPPAQPASLHDVALRVLGHPNVASRWAVFSRYDQEVQGSTVLRPGEADAGLIAPLPGCTAAVALSTDCVPRYCRLDPYLGAQLAVAEAARNVATTGAQPRALTDCLNMGNPEDPHAFWQFTEAVRGIADAARALGPQGISGPPLPIISGNVSFYNQSSTGRAIPPTPIIACVGVIDDCTRALGMQVVAPHATLVLLGNPRTGLGGSVYLDVLGAPPVALPPPDLEAEQRANALLPELARDCLLLAAHDVSDGGLLACLAEMLLGKDGDGRAGLTVQLDGLAERADVALFSEDGAIAVAVAPALLETVLARAKERRVTAHVLGTVDTGASRLRAVFAGQVVLDVPLTDVSSAWRGAVPEILA